MLGPGPLIVEPRQQSDRVLHIRDEYAIAVLWRVEQLVWYRVRPQSDFERDGCLPACSTESLFSNFTSGIPELSTESVSSQPHTAFEPQKTQCSARFRIFVWGPGCRVRKQGFSTTRGEADFGFEIPLADPDWGCDRATGSVIDTWNSTNASWYCPSVRGQQRQENINV